MHNSEYLLLSYACAYNLNFDSSRLLYSSNLFSIESMHTQAYLRLMSKVLRRLAYPFLLLINTNLQHTSFFFCKGY